MIDNFEYIQFAFKNGVLSYIQKSFDNTSDDNSSGSPSGRADPTKVRPMALLCLNGPEIFPVKIICLDNYKEF